MTFKSLCGTVLAATRLGPSSVPRGRPESGLNRGDYTIREMGKLQRGTGQRVVNPIRA